jgi:hypothetical protein
MITARAETQDIEQLYPQNLGIARLKIQCRRPARAVVIALPKKAARL